MVGICQLHDGQITISTRYVGGRWGAAYDPNVTNTFADMTSSDWTGYYNGLKNLNNIIEKATEAEAYNMVAAALTFRAEMTQIAVDTWGEMPYSEAA